MAGAKLVVADAGPIILLAVVNQLGVLTRLFSEIFIPPAVWDELNQYNALLDQVDYQSFYNDRIRSPQNANLLSTFVD